MIDFARIFEDAVVELETGLPLDEALSGAESTKFRNLLKKNIVKFRYKKKDGSVRTALGTLKKDMLPKYKTDKRPAYNPSRFVYWDTEQDQFRSFLRANFMGLEDPKKAGKKDEEAKLNESAEGINLFKPGTSVSVTGLFVAQLTKMGRFRSSDLPPSELPGLMRIAGQYDTMQELCEDMLQGEIPEYSNRYIVQNSFLTDTSGLNKWLKYDLSRNLPTKDIYTDYRPIRVSLYKSQKFGGKLMLGCYSLFNKANGYKQNPCKDYYFEYGGSRVIMPFFGLCITLTNLLDMVEVFNVREIDAGICNMAISNWDDHTSGWLAKQRVSEGEGVRVDDVSAEKLVNDWDFLDRSMAVKLCKIDCVAGWRPRMKGPDGVDKTLSKHFINHKACNEVRKYLKQNADLGRPIMQAVKRPQGRYENHDDRLCVLTDKAFQVEWYMSRPNDVKSISFCDPVQIVEWYVGSAAEVASASRVPDRSKIPVSFLKLAYKNQKAGLGFGLDHAV